MDGASVFPTVLIALGFGATGLYLMLPRGGEAIPLGLRQAGGAVAAISLVLIAVWVGRGAAATNESSVGTSVQTAVILVLAAAGVVCAAWTIISEHVARRALAFALLHLCNAALFALEHAWQTAGAILVFLAIGGLFAWRVAFHENVARFPQGEAGSHEADVCHDGGGDEGREPLLACFAAGLLTLAIAGTFAERFPTSGSALFGVVIFGIGGIGFVTRTSMNAAALAWGVMIQGALMTLAGFLGWHGHGQGDTFALSVLIVTGIEGCVALALARFFTVMPDSSDDQSLVQTGAAAAKELHG